MGTDMHDFSSQADASLSKEEKKETNKRKYEKNHIPKSSPNALFKKAIEKGILSIDDVVDSTKEDIMKTILDRVHPYAIQQLSDGRYFTYVADPRKLEGRRQIKRKSKAELFQFLIAYYGLAEEIQTSKTFGKLFGEWVEYKKRFINAPNTKKGLSSSTICRYERDYKNYIQGTRLDKAKLDKINAIMIENFFLDIIQENQMSDRCASNVFGYLNQCFAYAIRSDYMQKNPMLYVDKQLLLSRCPVPEQVSADEDRILTKAQMNSLRTAILEHQLAYPDSVSNYAIELALYTGMRLGELAALKWSCIDDLYIHIDYSEHRLDYSGKKSQIVIGEPKNRKHRKIPLTKETRNIFKKVRARFPYDENGFVFTRPDGSRLTGESIGAAVRKRAKHIGIDYVSIHRIRRTVSSLLNESLTQKDVADLLGHTEKVNEMHYNYSTADFQEKLTALNHLSRQMEEKVTIKIS